MCKGCNDLTEVLYGGVPLALDSVHEPERDRHWARSLLNGEMVLALTAAVLIANLLTHSALFSLAVAGAAMVLLAFFGLSGSSLLKRFIVPSYLTLVAVLTQTFLTGQTPLLYLGPLVAYREGLEQGILIGSKIIAGTSTVFLFGTVIRMPGLLATLQPTQLSTPWWQVLASRLHVPTILTEIAVLTYRYLFLLAEETQRIKQAQESRLGHRTWQARIGSFSTLLGMVVIRSFDRAEGVYEAMTLRGHNGTIVGTAKLTNSDLSGLVVVVPLIVLLLWIGYTI